MIHDGLATLFDDMARLKARMPYRNELRMNQNTFDRLGKVCGADIPDPALSGISSLEGTPIRLREYMYDNKIGIATFDDEGKEINYEVIDAFEVAK